MHKSFNIGRLSSCLTKPILVADGVSIYSCTVQGLGTSVYYESAMDRVEWLIYEWFHHVITFLHQRWSKVEGWQTTWDSIKDYLKLHWSRITLGVVVSPHKFALRDGEIQATARGANGREDFYLVGWSGKESVGTVCARHTTQLTCLSIRGKKSLNLKP